MKELQAAGQTQYSFCLYLSSPSRLPRSHPTSSQLQDAASRHNNVAQMEKEAVRPVQLLLQSVPPEASKTC